MPEEQITEIPESKVTEDNPQSYPAAMAKADARAIFDFLAYTLDETDKFELIEHELKGEYPFVKYSIVDGKKKGHVEWQEIEGRRWMNNSGVHKIMMMLRRYFSRIIATANLGTKENMGIDEAHRITELNMEVINDAVIRNIKCWEIDETLFRPLIAMLNDEIYFSLTRVKGGGIVKMFKAVSQRTEIYQPAKKEKKGLFSFLRRDK